MSGNERRLLIGLSGTAPYPVVTSDFGALYQGFVTELPAARGAAQYEEGVFEPFLRGSVLAGKSAYGAARGSWVRVGSSVTYTATVTVTGLGGMEGSVEIGDLPLSARNASGELYAAAVSEYGVTFTRKMREVSALVYSAKSSVTLLQSGANGRSPILASQLSPDTSFTVTGSYLVW